MALDGISISKIVSELNKFALGGRIDKIYQPESDEIIVSIRSLGTLYKLLMTANASHPRLHFTEIAKSNPPQPPMFCMVLRKHLTNGKITSIYQPNFERIVVIDINSMNELGDYSTKKLIIEIMGRHSNIILTDENNIILDSIKHISSLKSSIREVLPGREYLFPPSKVNPLEVSKQSFLDNFESKKNQKLQSIIYQSFNGISPIAASEICFRAGLDSSSFGASIDNPNLLYNEFSNVMKMISNCEFSPNIIYDDNKKIIDFSPFEMKQFEGFHMEYFETISELLDTFYNKRDSVYRLNQKSQDLKKLITQNIERCVKKKEIQIRTLKDIENREVLRLFGELITANIYQIKKGMTSFKTVNFYDENNPEIEIPLDSELTPVENSQKYFKKYNKAKRTFDALQIQIEANDEELSYLEGVLTSVQNCTDEQDIREIRQELVEMGFLKKTVNNKKEMKSSKKAKPLHYISSDGYDIYVGKNNKQNDELTLKFAKSNDMWFHTKQIPGSHVIVITNGKDLPDTTLNEAVLLAAYYSKAKDSSLVPVDYTLKKNVKKPSGAKPGMVIYETNKTAYITPAKELVDKLKVLN